MENKINLIIDELCKHEISKQEAKDRLLVLFGVEGSSDVSKEALNEAVSAIYFNNRREYLQALYKVSEVLSGVNDLFIKPERIEKLFNELNPE